MKKLNSSERKFIIGLKEGNEKVFQEIFHAYYKVLLAYAYDIIEKSFIAEDIVEDVFLKLWEHRNSIEIKHSLSNYLFKSVKNSCLDYIKSHEIRENYKQKVLKKIELDFGNNISELYKPDPLSQKELKRRIKKSINSLPLEYRKVFKMSRYYNLSNKEVSEKLGISAHTVGKHLKTAIRKIRESLKDYFD